MIFLQFAFFNFLSSVPMFLFCGRRARSKMPAVFVRMISFISSGSSCIAASTSQTIFLYGILEGVIANFGPFSSNEHSVLVRGSLLEKRPLLEKGPAS